MVFNENRIHLMFFTIFVDVIKRYEVFSVQIKKTVKNLSKDFNKL